MFRSILITALVIAGAVIAGAQTQPQPADAGSNATFKTGAEEVVLDVIVRDKHGKLVKNLEKKDFTVIDNGQSKPITSFRMVEGTEAVTGSGARTQLDPLRQVRLITLIFQVGGQDARKLSREAAIDLLKTDLPQNVYISVMAIDHRLEALQPFTNDREKLKAAIDHATGGINDFTPDSIQVTHDLEQTLGTFQGGDSSLEGRVAGMSNGSSGSTGPSSAPSGTAAASQAMAAIMLEMARAGQADSASTGYMATIWPLLEAVKEQYRLPGRKAILYFSEGWTIPEGQDQPFKEVISTANRNNVSFYAIDARGLNSTSLNGSAVSELSGAAGATRANATSSSTGVTIDQAQATDRAIESGRRNTQDTLAQLADETGGALIANTNDYRGPIRRLAEDIESYYELTYNPEISKYDGSFRKVSVKTDESNLKVQARAGYFALPPNSTAHGQQVSAFEVPLMQALDSKPVPHTFSFQTAGMHYKGNAGATVAEVVIDVPLADMTMKEDPTTHLMNGKLAYVALVKGANGEIVKRLHQELPLRIAADKMDAFKISHFTYNDSFALPPGRYTLETAVMDEPSEKISARKSIFMVPAANDQLGLSSIAIVRNTKQATDPKPDDPMVMAGKVVQPTVAPVVKKSESDVLPFYLIVYPDKNSKEKPTLTMRFSRDGSPIGAGSPPIGDPDKDGRIQYIAQAPLKTFEPGNYEVQFIAKQGQEQKTESVSFTLEP